MSEQQLNADRLVLTYDQKEFAIEVDSPPVIIGRDKHCEICICKDFVSRRHATVQHKRGAFVISDQSTNGTLIKSSHKSEIYINKKDHRLTDKGVICLGSEMRSEGKYLIYFSCK